MQSYNNTHFATCTQELPDNRGFSCVVYDKSSGYTLQHVLIPHFIVRTRFLECITKIVAMDVLGGLVRNGVEINAGLGITRIGGVGVVRFGGWGRVQNHHVAVQTGEVFLRPVVMLWTQLDGCNIRQVVTLDVGLIVTRIGKEHVIVDDVFGGTWVLNSAGAGAWTDGDRGGSGRGWGRSGCGDGALSDHRCRRSGGCSGDIQRSWNTGLIGCDVDEIQRTVNNECVAFVVAVNETVVDWCVGKDLNMSYQGGARTVESGD